MPGRLSAWPSSQHPLFHCKSSISVLVPPLQGAILRAFACPDGVRVSSGALEVQEPFVAKQKPSQGKAWRPDIAILWALAPISPLDVGIQWQRRRESYAVGPECSGGRAGERTGRNPKS
jgi:hypothetical protein